MLPDPPGVLKSFSKASCRPARSQSAGAALFRHVLIDEIIDRLLANAVHGRRQVLAPHDLGALLVDHLSLIVGDIVKEQELLSDVEVVRLDLALRLLDLARQHAALDDLARLHARHRQRRLVRLGSPKMRIRLSSIDR
jgi:hypothetical protein